ncbi:BON domain-containing protein [Oligoflexus tunisiensis]|uniref:BON domain-containing protein n=1 Tax=Oligoflexus tunisiensis TaxID=708132 RepID=UPI00159EFB06|nr:BON domain-containing protein [Oligoflexus tunisiensis]
MKLLSVLTSAGIGAALVYLFDPDSGNRRRALIRERANRTVHDAQRFLDVASRDLQNRSRGVVEGMRSRLVGQTVDDDRLVRRVAARLGHHMSRAKAVGITAENGVVTLQGPVLSSEVDSVVRAISRVPGVKELRNELQVHESPDTPEMHKTQRKRWTPGRRLAVGSAGLILAASTRSLMRGRRRA